MRGDTNNGFKETVRNVRVTAVDEFDAFDQLGPCTRQALRDSPLPWLAVAIVSQLRDEEYRLRQSNPDFYLDLGNPDLDRNIARGLMMQSMQVMLRDRSREDAELGIKPLRPRRTLRADYRR